MLPQHQHYLQCRMRGSEVKPAGCLDLCRPVSELKGGGGGVDGTAGWGTAFTPIWLQAFRHVSGLQTDVKGGVELSNPATVIIRSKQRQNERLCSCDGLTEGLDTVEMESAQGGRRTAGAVCGCSVQSAWATLQSDTFIHCSALQYGMHNIAFSVGVCTWWHMMICTNTVSTGESWCPAASLTFSIKVWTVCGYIYRSDCFSFFNTGRLVYLAATKEKSVVVVCLIVPLTSAAWSQGLVL